MILIDTNALVLLLIGLIDVRLINSHKRTSIYDEQDYEDLVNMIGGDVNKLIVLPNVWTETDNLLNKFGGNNKYRYIMKLKESMKLTTEKYISSLMVIESQAFYDLGLTDTLLLEHAHECEFLVTGDSSLSDRARANGILVYDLVKRKNQRLK